MDRFVHIDFAGTLPPRQPTQTLGDPTRPRNQAVAPAVSGSSRRLIGRAPDGASSRRASRRDRNGPARRNNETRGNPRTPDLMQSRWRITRSAGMLWRVRRGDSVDCRVSTCGHCRGTIGGGHLQNSSFAVAYGPWTVKSLSRCCCVAKNTPTVPTTGGVATCVSEY